MQEMRARLLILGCAVITCACGKPPEPLSCEDDQLVYNTCSGECVDLPGSCVGLPEEERCACLSQACTVDDECSDEQREVVSQVALDGTCDVTENGVVVQAEIIDSC